jgi:hypothetical protein
LTTDHTDVTDRKVGGVIRVSHSTSLYLIHGFIRDIRAIRGQKIRALKRLTVPFVFDWSEAKPHWSLRHGRAN